MIEREELKTYKSKKLACAGCYIDLSFDQEWDRIELIKDFFTRFAVSKTSEIHEVHRIGIAVSELLENAVKYSVLKKIRVIIQWVEHTGIFIISITNKANKENIAKLKERLKEMHSMDSLKFYIYRMRESVKNKLASPGLGLARVYHEAQADVSARVTEKKRLVEIKVIINLN
jgi:hypothetical protein